MGSEWQVSPLKEICSKIGSGATPRGGNSVYLDDGEFALIRSQNVRNESFDHNGLAFIEKHHADKLSNVIVEDKDVLLNITGDSVARCCQVDPKVLPARVNQHVAIIRPTPDILDSRYLRFYFLSPLMQNEMLSLAGVGATRNALTKGMIEGFEIPLPSLPEQKAIAHILGSLDDKVELNRRMNAMLEGMAQALFKSWFVDFDPVIDNALTAGNSIPDELAARAEVRRQALANGTANREAAKPFPAAFQQTESMGWIPEEWEVKTIGDLCVKIQNGGTPKRDNEEFWNNGTIPWLTSGEVRQSVILSVKNAITEYGLANSSAKWLPARSTVVAMYGATAGQVAFIHNKLTTNQAVCGLVPKEHFQYFNYLLIEGNVKHFENQARGSAQQNISKGIIEESAAIIPPLNVVQSFEGLAHPMFEKWAKNMETNDQLSKLRDTLLPKLISGELRMQSIEKSKNI